MKTNGPDMAIPASVLNWINQYSKVTYIYQVYFCKQVSKQLDLLLGVLKGYWNRAVVLQDSPGG